MIESFDAISNVAASSWKRGLDASVFREVREGVAWRSW